MQPAPEKRTLTIWSFVGFIFMIYGLVIGGAGVYYEFNPQTETALHNLKPSLWWGILLLVTGLLFNWIDLKISKKG